MTIENPLTKEILTTLFAELASWAGNMDAFRYEMLARRLVAAEYGRADAVEWAQAWYRDILLEERRAAEERRRQFDEEAARVAARKAEFKTGRCGNPNYQAFLDTVDHPERIENNAPYFAWISMLIGKFERAKKKGMTAEEKQKLWQAMIQSERDANLAPRLR